jgi:uncharacterized membrane protein YfcA
MAGDMEVWILAILCGAYFAAGFIDSVAGGGGLVSLPAFLLTGVAPELALGTNKMAASIGTAASLTAYARKGFVLWRLACVGIPCALLGGFAGSKAILLFDGANIGKILVFFLPLGMLATLASGKETFHEQAPGFASVYVHTPIICFVLGLYDGFFGPGTGSFFILAFHFIVKIGLIHASATAKMCNLTTGLGSLIAFALHGKVLYALVVPLAAANIAGNIVGARLAMKIGPLFVRKILLGSLSILFLSLMWKFFLKG